MTNNRVDIVAVAPVWYDKETGMQFTVSGFTKAQAEAFDKEFRTSFHGTVEHEEITPDSYRSQYTMPRAEARMFMGVLANCADNMHFTSNARQFKQQFKQRTQEPGSTERGV